MTSTALTPAAAAAVAALAARACEWRDSWCQPDTPGGRAGAGNPAGPNWPARAAAAARCAAAAGVVSVQILSTCSRNQGARAISGGARGEQGRAQLAALARAADLAVLDVPADPLAHQHGQLPVPAGQQGVEHRAGVPAGARDQQRAERSFQLAAGPGLQRVRVVAGHPQRGGQFVAVQPVHQAQLDDVPLAGIQAAERVADELAQFGLLDGAGDVDRIGGQAGRILQSGGELHRARSRR